MGCERVVVGWGSGVKGWWWCGVGCMVTGGGVGWGVKGWWWCGVGHEGVVAGWGGACRPPNSHSFGVRLTLLGQISLSSFLTPVLPFLTPRGLFLTFFIL